ncbi:putative Rrf2 family transcriptional regulator [Sphingomonas changbaiensis NBRC 104936]|uniref:Putative Rrf2 family transcriptional regulator n=1 Tax=Sphingomonas changbaiensis NBRC 104936 TaxID=1219043 RepID=A0A0E9MLC5_9SPHN|nr:putative Rrf2 family transcriptional regulator [Sphingomonas changbaiensis NBRC 104936]
MRHTEEGFDLVDCGDCVIAPACGITGVLREALGAFMAVLDRYTLDDLMRRRTDIAALLAGISPLPPGERAGRA